MFRNRQRFGLIRTCSIFPLRCRRTTWNYIYIYIYIYIYVCVCVCVCVIQNVSGIGPVFVQHGRKKAVNSHLFTSLFMFIHLPLIHFAPPPRLLIDFKNSKWLTYIFASYYALLCICYCYCFSHLISLLSVTDYLAYINSHFNFFILCFPLTKAQCSKR